MKKLDYEIILSLKDKISQAVNNIKASFSKVSSEVSDASTKAQRFKGICDSLNYVRSAAIVENFRNIADGFNQLAAGGTEFQQSIADLSAITGIIGNDLKGLEEQARSVGKATGLGASQAAEAYKLLASQIDVSKIGMDGLNKLQSASILLAQASGATLSESANTMAATINQYGLQATEATRVINVLAAGAKYGASEVPDLAQSLKVVGATANAAGISLEQTAGAIEVLSKNNLKGSEAGTALRNIMLKLQTELGVDLSKTGLASSLEALKPKLNDAAYLSKLFGMENVAAAQFLITNAESVQEMTDRVTDTNVAQEQASIRTDTTSAKLAKLKARFDDIKISVFNASGGMVSYVGVLAEQAVMVSQMLPLLGKLGTAISWITNLENLKTVAVNIGSAATKVAVGIQAALNFVLSANPIGLVVIAIAALVAGIVLAWNKCEGFRKVVLGSWEAIKDFGKAIWSVVTGAFTSLTTGLGTIGDAIKFLFQGKFDEAAKAAKEGMKKIGQAALSANPVGLIAKSIQKTDFSGAYSRGSANATTTSNKRVDSVKTSQSVKAADIDLSPKASKSKSKETAQFVIGVDYTALKGVDKQIAELFEKVQSQNIAPKIDLSKIGKDASPILNEYAKEIKIATNENKIFGDTQTLLDDQIDITTTAIRKLIADGFDPMSMQVQALVMELDKLVKKRNEIDKSKKSVIDSIWGDDSVIGDWARSATKPIEDLQRTFIEFGKVLKTTTLTTTQKAIGGLQGIGAMMGQVSGMVSGAAANWLSWGANLLGAISAAIPAMMAMIGVTTASTLATNADTSAKVVNAAAGALAANAGLGPWGWIASIAAVGGIIAAMASIPKFADGGIVYGDTLARVGEYSGASSNPEVIAPLNKLKGLLGGSGGGTVEFVIDGRVLRGVLNKVDNFSSRTR